MPKYLIDFDGSMTVEADNKERAIEAMKNRLSATGVEYIGNISAFNCDNVDVNRELGVVRINNDEALDELLENDSTKPFRILYGNNKVSDDSSDD